MIACRKGTDKVKYRILETDCKYISDVLYINADSKDDNIDIYLEERKFDFYREWFVYEGLYE